jgi:hypothetical protein
MFDPKSPEYSLALIRCGLEILAHRPFREFTIVVKNTRNYRAGVEFIIHDPRAVSIRKHGEYYAIELSASEADRYPLDGFFSVEMEKIRMDEVTATPKAWYTRVDPQ